MVEGQWRLLLRLTRVTRVQFWGLFHAENLFDDFLGLRVVLNAYADQFTHKQIQLDRGFLNGARKVPGKTTSKWSSDFMDNDSGSLPLHWFFTMLS